MIFKSLDLLSTLVALRPATTTEESPMVAERIAGGVRLTVGSVVVELDADEVLQIGELVGMAR
jgi:hypothetical protein